MCLGSLFGGGSSDNGAEELRQQEEQRQQRIKQGEASIDQAFSQFNDAYFNKRAQDYRDFAMPQLEDQYGQAKKNLVFALSRNHLTNSSVATEKAAKLGKEYNLQHTAVEGQAMDAANQLRQSIESNRSDVLNQLFASADPQAAASQAIARAKSANLPASFSPLGALFQDFSAIGANNAYAQSYGGGVAPVGVKLFSSIGGAGPSYTVRG